MEYKPFITDLCRNEAGKYNCLTDLEKVSHKILVDQSIGTFDRFLPTPFIRKKIGANRIIAVERIVGEINYICLLRVIPRGSAEYRKFVDDPIKYFSIFLPDDNELMDSLISSDVVPEELKTISDIESEYLYCNYHANDDEEHILETEEWIKRINDNMFREYRSKYFDVIVDIVSKPTHQLLASKNDDPRIKILYRTFPNSKKIVLIAPLAFEEWEKDKDELEKKYSTLFQNPVEDVEENEIIRNCRKSYPSYIIFDDSIWFTIQKNSEGNLALSPEEDNILNSIRVSQENSPKYPLFINGRPGSGKSTILLYLFSDLLFYHSKRTKDRMLNYPPIFLTYNDKLLEVAKNSVKNIIKCDYKKLENKGSLSDDSFDQLIQKSFQKFHPFLLSLLPKTEAERFRKKNKFIDFPKFRALFISDMKKTPDSFLRNLTPELAWHIIRTYIKGMSNSVNDYFDEFCYKEELPRNQRTVSSDTYEKIYTRVWQNWYKPLCDEKDLWDDQDLTRTVLDFGVDLSKYPAVFGDEAQDFTKNELELILKLSLYSKRTIPANSLKDVPFAFAGDPFQTLNPTGFNWNSVQANFHEKIVQELDKFGNGRLKFNFKELSFNYRSSKNIVRLCNLIQMMRGVMFNIKDLQPQKTWFLNESEYPAFFHLNDLEIEKALKEQTELVIIIPCQEGEEFEYVSNDHFLKSIAIQDGQISRNILTPMRAKGLEFSRVVLYKFGEECYLRYQDKIIEMLNSEHQKEKLNAQDIEDFLSYQYFINNLYVAASRAKNKLYIIDTPNGKNYLWKFAKDNLDDIFLKYSDISASSQWEYDDIGGYVIGESITDKDRDNPIELAELFLEQGYSSRNPQDFKLAAQNFERGGDSNRAKYAEAKSYEYESKHKMAAEIYKKLGKNDDALKCFWKGSSYDKIIELGVGDPDILKKSKYKAAEYMSNRDKKTASTTFLSYIYDTLQEETAGEKLVEELLTDVNWKNVLQQLINTINNIFKHDNKVSTWKRIYTQLKLLSSKGLDIRNDAYAKIAFNSEDYQEALSIWEHIDHSKNEDYKAAKAFTENYPANIYWFEQIGRYDNIIEEFEKNGSSFFQLDTNQVQTIVNAYYIQKKYDNIIAVFEKTINVEFDRVSLHYLLDSYLELGKIDQAYNYFYFHLNENEIIDLFPLLQEQGHNIHKNLLFCCLISKKMEDKEQTLNEVIKLSQIKSNGVQAFGNFKPVHELNARMIIYNLIKNSKIDTDDKKEQGNISSYLRNHLMDRKNWGNEDEVYLYGTAIERTGILIDMLNFYSNILKKESFSEELVEFARLRWIKCKLKQSDYYAKKAKNNKKDSGKFTMDSERLRKEAEKAFVDWDLNLFYSIKKIDELPKYNVAPLKFRIHADNLHLEDFVIEGNEVNYKEIEKAKSKGEEDEGIRHTENTIEDVSNKVNAEETQENVDIPNIFYDITVNPTMKLKIEHNCKKKSLRITHMGLDELIVALGDKKKVYGEVDFSSIILGDGSVLWENKDWNIWVCFKNRKDKDFLTIAYGDYNREIVSIPIEI